MQEAGGEARKPTGITLYHQFSCGLIAWNNSTVIYKCFDYLGYAVSFWSLHRRVLQRSKTGIRSAV